jgi:hypothetical protein
VFIRVDSWFNSLQAHQHQHQAFAFGQAAHRFAEDGADSLSAWDVPTCRATRTSRPRS